MRNRVASQNKQNPPSELYRVDQNCRWKMWGWREKEPEFYIRTEHRSSPDILLMFCCIYSMGNKSHVTGSWGRNKVKYKADELGREDRDKNNNNALLWGLLWLLFELWKTFLRRSGSICQPDLNQKEQDDSQPVKCNPEGSKCVLGMVNQEWVLEFFLIFEE